MMQPVHDPATGRSWETPDELADYLLKAHHAYLRMMLSHLERLAEQVVRERRVPPEHMDRFQREFTALAGLLDEHLARAEGWLFPQISQLCEAVSDFPWACELGEGLETVLTQAAWENREALERLGRVRECFRDGCWQDKGWAAEQLLHNVENLADRVATHVRLEDDFLFPWVRRLLECRKVLATAL
jgi:iron-sulfur cluster repair protein YtfE (RIC family)